MPDSLRFFRAVRQSGTVCVACACVLDRIKQQRTAALLYNETRLDYSSAVVLSCTPFASCSTPYRETTAESDPAPVIASTLQCIVVSALSAVLQCMVHPHRVWHVLQYTASRVL